MTEYGKVQTRERKTEFGEEKMPEEKKDQLLDKDQKTEAAEDG